jgi:hypothetical protein
MQEQEQLQDVRTPEPTDARREAPGEVGDRPVVGWGFQGPPPQRVTPGLVLGALSPQRASRMAERLCTSISSLLEGSSPQEKTARLLALLTSDELRSVARAVGVDDRGHFIHVYLRLARLC